jgi:hypothetical protein
MGWMDEYKIAFLQWTAGKWSKTNNNLLAQKICNSALFKTNL